MAHGNKKTLTGGEIADIARVFFIDKFGSYSQAADYFETSIQTISNINTAKQSPSKEMLLAMGYRKVKSVKYVRVK